MRITKVLFILALMIGFSPKANAFFLGISAGNTNVAVGVGGGMVGVGVGVGGYYGGGYGYGGYGYGGYGYGRMPYTRCATGCGMVAMPIVGVGMHGYVPYGGYGYGYGYGYYPRYVNAGCNGCGRCGSRCGTGGGCRHQHRCFRGGYAYRRPVAVSVRVGGFGFGLRTF